MIQTDELRMNVSKKSASKDNRCPICHSAFQVPRSDLYRYDDVGVSHIPKVLDCLHTFCESCLEHKHKISNSPSTVDCPYDECQFLTPVDQNLGINGLPHSFIYIQHVRLEQQSSSKRQCEECVEQAAATHHCVTCGLALCNFHHENHLRSRATASHQLLTLKEFKAGDLHLHVVPRPQYCSLHTNEVLKIYCLQCQKSVCHDCVLESHQEHEHDFAEHVVAEACEQLNREVNEATQRIEELKASLPKIRLMKKSVNQKTVQIQNEISRLFEGMRNVIDEREESMLKRLQDLHQQKTAILTEQESEIDFTAEELKRVSDYIQSVVGSEIGDVQVMQLFRPCLTRIQGLLQEAQSVEKNPMENEAIFFHSEELIAKHLAKRMQYLGAIFSDRQENHDTFQTIPEERPESSNSRTHLYTVAVQAAPKIRVPGLTRDIHQLGDCIVVEFKQAHEQASLEGSPTDKSDDSSAILQSLWSLPTARHGHNNRSSDVLGRVVVVLAVDVHDKIKSQLVVEQHFDSFQDPHNLIHGVPTIQVFKVVRSKTKP